MLFLFAHYTPARIQLAGKSKLRFCLLVVERGGRTEGGKRSPDEAKGLSAAAPVVEWVTVDVHKRDVTGPQGPSSIDISRFPLSSLPPPPSSSSSLSPSTTSFPPALFFVRSFTSLSAVCLTTIHADHDLNLPAHCRPTRILLLVLLPQCMLNCLT
jgi:hypothetical protein